MILIIVIYFYNKRIFVEIKYTSNVSWHKGTKYIYSDEDDIFRQSQLSSDVRQL